jgi:hypothetical protein
MEAELTIDHVAKETKEYEGKFSRGIMVGKSWYNVRADKKENVDALFNEEMLHQGNKVKVEIDEFDKTISKFISLVSKSQKHEEDKINLEVLLNDAHNKGLAGIRTKLLSHDPVKKTAVVKAEVAMLKEQKPVKNPETGKMESRPPIMLEFHGIGDASPENTDDSIKKHYLRFAESRALVRALRWMTNNAKVADEEKE